jgi:carboxyl-terminal processing protease
MMLDDTLNIYNVLKESPAYKAGLRPGDKVIQIGDSIVANQNLEFDEIRPLMQKNIGDMVKLMVIPLEGGEAVERQVEIGPVPLHSADIAYMINDKTGYIQIKRFGSNTYKEFMLGLEEMFENEGLKNLIIDVRQNPGGYLPQATDILSQLFIQKGHLLVYTEGKNERLTEYMTTGKSFFPIDKIAVLVDGGSASGSEILAGAIQDWDRGIIIGRRTFGKGLVQEQYNLKNGGALRLTIARYYTPAGRLIQKPYKDLDEYAYEQSNRLNSGELEDEEKMTINDSTQYFTLKDQRVVYGGGGIIPDYFVPIDSKTLNSEYRAISDYLTEFVYIKFKERYFGNDREIDFDGQQISILYDELKDYVLSKNPSINQDAFEEWKTELSIQLHASIGYQLKGEKEMVKILNNSDHDVQKALEEIGN